MKNYYVIIDADPGIDDSLAIMNALNSDKIEVKLISTVAGNMPIEETMKNTLKLVELFQKDVPVAQGASEPLKRQPCYATAAQGECGLGGYKVKNVKREPFVLKSPDAIHYFLCENMARNTTLLCMGPMTNIANLLTKYPEARDMISRIVFMGGSKDEDGSTQPYKEFNVAFDPEAMKIVLDSNIPLVMVPMELGHIAYLTPEEQQKIRRANSLGEVFYKMFTKYNDYHVGKLGAAVHDSCSAIYLTNPEIFHTEPTQLSVEYATDNAGNNYGYIKCDMQSATPNASVCVDMDVETFKKIVFGSLFNYN